MVNGPGGDTGDPSSVPSAATRFPCNLSFPHSLLAFTQAKRRVTQQERFQTANPGCQTHQSSNSLAPATPTPCCLHTAFAQSGSQPEQRSVRRRPCFSSAGKLHRRISDHSDLVSVPLDCIGPSQPGRREAEDKLR